jgi:diacylglycerol kinase (ATP)
MRYIFIVNPLAGKGREQPVLIRRIESYFAKNGGSYAVIPSKSREDTAAIAREEALKGGNLRLYAVGGDGTLSDIVNGVHGCQNVEIGAIPCGSGNDFVAAFGDRLAFLDVEGQVKGTSVPLDLIKTPFGFAVNQCSVGFDGSVVLNQKKLKNFPFIDGSFSYSLAIFYSFIRNIRFPLRIRLDGGEIMAAETLLCIAANGPFYGGGFKSAPTASPCDGVLEFVRVDAVSRMTILRFLKKYRVGEHYSLPFVHPSSGKKIEFFSEREFPVNIDGEVSLLKSVAFEVVKQGVKFILPAVCAERLGEEARANTGILKALPAFCKEE